MMQTKPLKPSKLDWKPQGYQRKALKFMLQNSCAALFLDPGLGKTSISLAAHKVLLQEKLLHCGLIIAPLRVCYSVWPKELAKWSNFEGMTLAILHGKDKEKLLAKPADLYVINPEGLPWLLAHPLFKKKFRGQALYVDESSKFKDTQTKRFKLLRPHLENFGRRYILTGSPAPNGLLDLFGQMFILDLGNALGRYVTHYRSAYFYPTGYGGYDWKLQPGADKRIQDRIRPLTLRMDAEDYIALPKLIINPVEVELDEKAWAIYKEMEDELIAAIENKDVVAASAAVASGKCAQIANGGIYDGDRKAHFVHDLKAQATAEIVSELNGTPALIAYEYGHDLERLKDVFGKNVPYIGGGVSTKRSVELEHAWNAGELPVLLGQPASIAHGLNLQNAGNHVIWHSLPWNFEYYDQFNRRIRRQGSTHDKVFVHHIICRNTVDELKLHALNRKFRTQQDLFDALNTFLKRGFTPSQNSAKSSKSKLVGLNNPKEKEMSNKFAKKTTEAVAEAPKSKVKLWTNNPDWQDQDTGVNTAEGDAQQKKANVRKFEKVSDKNPAAKPAKASKSKKEAAPAGEAPKRRGRAPSDESVAAEALNPKSKISVVNAEGKLYRGAKNRYYDFIKSSKNVAAALEAGARSKDLVRAVEAGLITLS